MFISLYRLSKLSKKNLEKNYFFYYLKYVLNEKKVIFWNQTNYWNFKC